jgi:hypothetical protein
MAHEPISPSWPSLRIKRRLVGVAVAIAASIAMIVIYDVIPLGVRFPVIILAIPALAIAAGLFQALTGLTIFEVNAELPTMPTGRKILTAGSLIILLVAVLGAFLWLLFR